MDAGKTATVVGGVVALAVAVVIALGAPQITRSVSLGTRRITRGLGRVLGVTGMVLIGVGIAAVLLWLAWVVANHSGLGVL